MFVRQSAAAAVQAAFQLDCQPVRPRQLLSEPSLPEPEWYLAVAPAFPVVQEFDRHREWAEELSQALHSFQGRFLEQPFVWKWGLSRQAFYRVAEQGLVPVFHLSRENLAAEDQDLTPHEYEAEARRQLAGMNVAVSRANSADVPVPLAIPFPKTRNEAQPLFRHCVEAPWCQVADIPGALPAYTEMFLASPAVVRLWVAQLGAEPQWLCL